MLGQALLALEMNALRTGDEHLSPGDKHVENIAFELQPHTHTHTQLELPVTSRKIYAEMIALRRFKRYLDAPTCIRLH